MTHFGSKSILILQVPISGSFYSIHLKEWLNVFPRQQIFITRTEDFASNVAGTLLNIFRFLKLGKNLCNMIMSVMNHF